MMRLIKVLLAVFVAIFCIGYAVQNIVNLQAAHGFVAYVASMADHGAYPAHFGPAITSSALTWIMLWIIIALEMGAGLLAAKGAYDLFTARSATADDFNAAKSCAMAGCGVGIIVWFGLFSAIAGTYPGVLGFHDLKTRMAGSRTFVTLHIELDGDQSLYDAHEISAGLRSKILEAYPHTDVMIHKDVWFPPKD